MTFHDASADTTLSASQSAEAVAQSAAKHRPPAPPSFAWRRGAFLLAGAAQLITISALVSADPLAATWASLLLAIAPVLLIAVAAFAPAPTARLACAAGLVALLVGIVGAATHTGLFFVPAFIVLAIGTVTLWRERQG